MLINLVFWLSNVSAQTGLDGPVKYEARDSIVANISRQTIILYGEAFVSYEGIELEAEYIEIKMGSDEVLATYSLDSLGNPVGKPIFTSEGEESKSDYVKYNFKTKKGYIKEVRAEQGEGYIHMQQAKIHSNEQIHLKNGKFTTCENDTPHYHFKLTKAIIVPNKRVVTGPVYMKIFKVPTPLAAPFAFFPNSEKKQHGIILPEFASSSRYGFGLQDFGYYIPLGQYWETQFTGTIFTSGRFGVKNATNYYKKYKYRGSFSADFQQLRGQFYDTTSFQNKLTLRWRHTQDVKAHPSLGFSANINFISDNNGKSNLKADNPDYFTNQFNSSVLLSKSWSTKKLRGNSTLKADLQQSSISGSYTLNLPDFNFTISRFDLGVFRKNRIGKKWFEEINVQYVLNSSNRIIAPDSIFNTRDYQEIGDYALNGIEQRATVNSNLKFLGGRFTFTPSANYREIWNFQYESYTYDTGTQEVDTTELAGFGNARNLSFTGNLATGFYGLYKYKGKRHTRFKHVANPSVSFTYRPDISNFRKIQENAAGESIFVSPFATSRYVEQGRGKSGRIGWNLANTLKMKTRDMNDSINELDKSFNLVDAFSINGGYDIFKDSLQLSNQRFTFRTSKFLKIFSFQSDAILSPYTYDSLNRQFAIYAWKSNQGVGTFTQTNLTVNANFTSKLGRKKQKELSKLTANNAQNTEQFTDPNKANFDIPWQVNVSYNLRYAFQQNKALSGDPDYNVTQTVRLNGDFSINQKWKFKYGINFNLQQFNSDYQDNLIYPYEDLVTNYNFEIWRDLHCWEALLQFTQYGPLNKDDWTATNWTFLFRINIKATMFQDIKLEYNQIPFF